jgi:pimeloyl-ACP methyl ester carboxylesterase
MRRWPRGLPGLVVVLVVLSLSTTTAHAGVVQAPASAGSGDLAGLVDIGSGRQMYLDCRGSGSPTVVLLSGYGNASGVWSAQAPGVSQPPVLPTVAGFSHVCAYDRPGTDLDDPVHHSRSDLVSQPRGAQDTVDDLHALLHAAAVPGPYVLAGHSLGGLYARLYASTYPDDVVGLALVDAISERFRAVLSPEAWDASLAVFQYPLSLLADYPDHEEIDFDATFDLMLRTTAAHPLRQMPLAVLSAGSVPDVSGLPLTLPSGFQAEFTAAAQTNQAYQATLTPYARWFVVESGHYIQLEQPQVVTEAIRQVVEGVRDPDTWYDLNSCCAN